MNQPSLRNSLLLTILFYGFCFNCFSQNLKKDRKKITTALEKAYELDQKLRQEYNACIAASGGTGDACKKQRDELTLQDSANQKIVGSVLDQYGWLSKKQTSDKANKAFFYVIQHAPLQFQSQYSNLIDTTFKKKEISPLEYAFFVDRFRTKQGLAQLYGTQSETDNLGNSYLYPLKNWDTVNKIRSDLKLPPLDLFQTPEYHFYPRIVDNDTIVLIGHIFDKTNSPISNAEVSLDSKTLGKSNDKGFFIINIKRPPEGTKVLVQVGSKKNATVIKGLKDFYQIYMQF